MRLQPKSRSVVATDVLPCYGGAAPTYDEVIKMMYKGKPIPNLLIGLDAEQLDPYEAVLEVRFHGEPNQLSAVDLLTFIEENYEMISKMCAECHEQWVQIHGLPDNVVRIH
jgi:hypothetical protein